MTKTQKWVWLTVCTVWVLTLSLLGLNSQTSVVKAATSGFVTRSGSNFVLNGSTYRFGGTNTYYLANKSQYMVNNDLTSAANNNFQVVRTWGFIDIGNSDGSNSVDGIKDGVYYQYWNGSAPAYNDGSNGLQHLDYVIYEASQLNLRLTIVLTNNWTAYGGMDQYVKWRGDQYHDQFYTDSTIQQWYKNWVSHVLNHVNYYSGIAYKNDPAIFSWELANEPRCSGSGTYPTSSSCNTSTLTNWVSTMSNYIKGIDGNHLLGVGDEGFYCNSGSSDWTSNCSQGVDSVALASLSSIDYMGLHDYPEDWGESLDWGTSWITSHISNAHSLGKPVIVGEFGVKDQNQGNNYYQTWTQAIYNNGGNGFDFWMLAGYQDNGSLYPDYDGYTVYCPGTFCTTLSNSARQMENGSSSGGGGSTPTPTPTSGGGGSATTLYDFENGNTQNWSGSNITGGPWSVTEWAAHGSYSLKADVNLGYQQIALKITAVQNLAGHSQLQARVKNAPWGNMGSGMTAKLYVKTGSGWAWYDGGSSSVNSSGATTLTLNLASIPNLNYVQEIGVEFDSPSNSSGTSAVYVDYVTIQ